MTGRCVVETLRVSGQGVMDCDVGGQGKKVLL